MAILFDVLSGICFAVGFLCTLQVVIGYYILVVFSKKSAPISFQKSPPLTLFSKELSDQLKLNLKDFSSTNETCDWFNQFLDSLYFKHIGSEKIRQWILDSITSDFQELREEHPNLLEVLEVEHFTLGTHLPELRNVRLRSTDDLKTDLFLVFDFSYQGGAYFGVRIVSFGRSISIQVSLTRIEGRLIAEVVDWPVPYLQLYFYSEPRIDFSLQFGEQKFKWFAQAVSNKIKQFLIKQIVYPNGYTYHLTMKGQEWHNLTKEKLMIGEILNQPGVLFLHLISAEGLQKGDYMIQAKIARQKFETKVVDYTTSPIWDETFCFDLRKISLDASLQIKLKNTGNEKYSFVIEIPLGNLPRNIVHLQTEHLITDGDFKIWKINAPSMCFGILLITADKATFLNEISKSTKRFSVYESADRNIVRFDEHISEYIMISDGEKELSEDSGPFSSFSQASSTVSNTNTFPFIPAVSPRKLSLNFGSQDTGSAGFFSSAIGGSAGSNSATSGNSSPNANSNLNSSVSFDEKDSEFVKKPFSILGFVRNLTKKN